MGKIWGTTYLRKRRWVMGDDTQVRMKDWIGIGIGLDDYDDNGS